MKNKNKPKRQQRQQPKVKKTKLDSTKHRPFNPWVYKYFDMTAEDKDNGR